MIKLIVQLNTWESDNIIKTKNDIIHMERKLYDIMYKVK